MSEFWIARAGQKFGPYAEDIVRANYARGKVLATDLLWREGMAQWEPASQLLGGPAAAQATNSPPPIAAPASPAVPAAPQVNRDEARENGAVPRGVTAAPADQTSNSGVALWNPNAAACWSVLFSPIFGGWVHAKNWAALGDESRAKQSMYWVYGGIVALLAAVLLPYGATHSVGIGYLLAWYFASGKAQVGYVRERFGTGYERKKWGRPLGLALGGFVIFAAIAGVLVYNFDLGFQKETALSDISGVWRANQDGAMVTFRLEGKKKTIEINGKSIPVVVDRFDDDNKILALKVRGSSSMIWTVRQIPEAGGRFHLSLTLHDGTQDELSFVRNL
ncbi:MAG TPA: DUF4339 domain-containing protein [Burkholderiales bacterium]|nr:DUF4339 domain-containing protein [Burkholderiales bacterium]